MRALGRTPRLCGLVVYSPAASPVSKSTCFPFEEGATPFAVIKTMPDRRYAWRLRHETDVVAAIRRRLASAPEVAAALPLPPLHSGHVDTAYVVVEPLDGLARATGSEAGEATLAWLRRFQSAAAAPAKPWTPADTDRTVASVERAWGDPRLGARLQTARRTRELLAVLEGTPLRRCPVHGDFWQGNVAHLDGALRVYDWEWADLDGLPFFDLWSYLLGPVRERARRQAAELLEPLRYAVAVMERELGIRDIHPGFAVATLPAVIGELAFRARWRLERPSGDESASIALMLAVDRLLATARH